MRRPTASFSVDLLGGSARSKRDIDRALTIFVENTSPLLRTKTNQIRVKIDNPANGSGRFYFTALYRGNAVIGFSMFGHYPDCRVLVVDHMVIDGQQRGDAAFYIFSQLLQDLIQEMRLEIDFTIVELEKTPEFGGPQTGGVELARLLGQIGFGEVHIDYVIPEMDVRVHQKEYDGILLIRGPERLYKMKREDLVQLHHTVLFEHYLPWYEQFLGSAAGDYADYLKQLHQALCDRLRSDAYVNINGPEVNVLAPILPVQEIKSHHPALHFSLTVLIAASVLAASYLLRLPSSLVIPYTIIMLLGYAAVTAVASGKSLEVLEMLIRLLPNGQHRSSYRQPDHSPERASKSDPSKRKRRQIGDGRSSGR